MTSVVSRFLRLTFLLLAAITVPTRAQQMIGLPPDLTLTLLGTAEAAALEAALPENGKFDFRAFSGMAISGVAWGTSVYDAADPESYYAQEFWYGVLATTTAVIASKAMLHFPDWHFEPILLAGMYGSNTMGLGYRIGWRSYSVTIAKGSFGDKSVGAPSPTLLFDDMTSLSFAYMFRVSPRWSLSPELGYRTTDAVVSDNYRDVDQGTVQFVSALFHTKVRVFDGFHVHATLGCDAAANSNTSQFLSRNDLSTVGPNGGLAVGYEFGRKRTPESKSPVPTAD
jgi:hypothetical protein